MACDLVHFLAHNIHQLFIAHEAGDRSEKIRTYNFPQGRVTDHRINLTLYKLESILNGDLDEFIEELGTQDQTDRLQAMAETE